MIYIEELNESNYSENYVHWMDDHRVTRFLESRFQTYDQEKIVSYIKLMQLSQNDHLFGIFIKKTNEHIGNIKLGDIDNNHKYAEVGLLIGNEQYWGQGIGTSAIGLVVDYAFNSLGLNKLYAGMYSTNGGSHKAFINNGFTEIGRYSKHYLDNGVYVDKICVELLNIKYLI
jgi:[ribosomal protein S5]-alanine N-acetyltransferase